MASFWSSMTVGDCDGRQCGLSNSSFHVPTKKQICLLGLVITSGLKCCEQSKTKNCQKFDPMNFVCFLTHTGQCWCSQSCFLLASESPLLVLNCHFLNKALALGKSLELVSIGGKTLNWHHLEVS